MESFVPLAERIVEAVLESRPGLATSVGDHRYDDRLPDLSAGAVAADQAMLKEAADALSEIDPDALDVAEQVDHALLSSLVDRGLFESTEMRAHEWDPLRHNPGPLLHALLARPFAPADVRLTSLAGRLAAVPDALATARATLRDMPRIHAETAVGQFTGTAALIRDELPALLAQAPSQHDRVEPAATAAIAALEEFVAWLRVGLAADTGPGRDPRLGRRRWEARLWHTLDTELGAAEIQRRAWANLDRVTAEIREAAVELVGGRADDAAVRQALDMLAAEHPNDGTIVELAGVTLDEATDFVRAHDLITLVDDKCVIQEMPEFARGVAVAYCDSPGPLETAAVPTFYCIAPTPSDWPAHKVESFYREYNDHMIRNLTVHEAMPGHFLQLAHARRYVGDTRVRALAESGPFIEGWAVYAEELMVGLGFGGLPVRLQQLKMQLRMTINALLDQLVHAEDLPEAEAMALMTGRGFQEEGEAAGKWRRAQLTSTQLSTYFVGYSEVAEIAAARPDGVSVRDWHDAMLAHDCPPPRHLRTLLGL
ncbi:DUF885 domain-containing protein [Micromonospora parathelypteridis]|uniref:Uncharacterized protein (DUF885 family) n=1 Tax=Micromonospora parathelypteridis TaxID=1839617 RepID=A0A840W1T4_9ACTN|nr:DUF885 domain-containing protein [Micromonospora parathelypteridis]MBB5479128.1 uncharacterized protein (DUF885 family) [Micromonospora parathelypteridis]GGO02836.1 hypothetical protein GCM10011576_02720 [Micromonospora parathelypteridis]